MSGEALSEFRHYAWRGALSDFLFQSEANLGDFLFRSEEALWLILQICPERRGFV